MILPSRPVAGAAFGVLAGVLTALSGASVSAQAYPGVPRAHRFGAVGSVVPYLVAGEFTGDGRVDALVLRDGDVDLLHAVSGFGGKQRVPSPGDGRITHVARIAEQGDRGRDLGLLCVVDGPSPGLHSVLVDDQKNVTSTPLGPFGWGGVQQLVVLEHGSHAQVFGLSPNGDFILTGVVRERGWENGPTLRLPAPVQSIRAAAWTSDSDHCVLGCSDNTIYVISDDGSLRETVQTQHPVHDFDAGYSRYLGHGRLAVITWDARAGESWFELHDPHGHFRQLQFLGVSKPRIVLRDLLERGDVDVCAVNTHGPNGYATFGGLGPTPHTFDFGAAGGLIPFEFQSPSFGTASSHSNVDLYDADGDGDRDVLFGDASEGAVWVQPSWAIHEFERAPTVAQITPQYSHQNPAWQWMHFQVQMPVNNAGMVPTHAEIVIYQTIGGGLQQQQNLVANAVVEVHPGPDGMFNTGTLPVYGQYQGSLGTYADYVLCVRMLQVNEESTGWERYGVESYTAFHHYRTPDPAIPGFYMDGAAGGVNPLPSVGGPAGGPANGVGEVPPPPPPPPSSN